MLRDRIFGERAPCSSDSVTDVVDEFFGEGIRSTHIGCQLYEGFDVLTHLGTRNAEDGAPPELIMNDFRSVK